MRVYLKADALADLMARRNLSQNEVARRARIAKGHLSLMMHGQRQPGPRIRERLQQALDVTTWDELFGIDRENRPAP